MWHGSTDLEGNHFPAKIAAAADRHGALKAVMDEYGNPTYALDAAEAICGLVETRRYGTYHFVNEGHVSRYEFAKTVLKETGREAVPVAPIPSSEWPRAARPPLHAVLRNQAGGALGLRLRPWKEALVDYLRLEEERYARPQPDPDHCRVNPQEMKNHV